MKENWQSWTARSRDRLGSHDPVSGELPVTVELVEELGGSRVAYCSLAEQQLAVVLPKSFDVIDGGALYLTFPENALHGFDAVSGKRLAKAVLERPRLVPA
jgi:sn-glycerol 3-phosphate transport system ATP-binding protein